MKPIFDFILWNSIYSAMIAIVVLVLRIPLRRAPRIFSYLLWSVVFFRMICPLSLNSELSVIPDLAQDYQFYSQNAVMGYKNDFAGTYGIEENTPYTNDKIPATSSNESLNSSESVDTHQKVFFQSMQYEINADNIILFIWFLVFIILTLLLVFSYIKLKYKIQTATKVTGNIYESDQIDTAFVFGVIRPKIYIPCWIKNDNRYRFIISHEQVHIQRLDYIIKPVICIITMLHWFNPFAWISYICMCRDMEISCDEAVLNTYGENIKKEYSGMLLNFGTKHILSIETAFGETSTKNRIKNTLSYRKPTRIVAIIAAIAVLMTITACIGNRSSDDLAVTNEPNEFTQAYEESVKDFEFSIENGTATVKKYMGNKSSIDIPASYLGYPVTTIGPSFMMNNSTAAAVNIPESVEVINEFAFQYCTSLEYINIPNSVKYIGSQCFEGCTSLEKAVLSEGLINMGTMVFNQCINLREINIPSSLIIIPARTFSDCSALKSITLNYGLEEIEKNAFINCNSLEEITIPDGVWIIGDSAFENCTMLSTIEIPESLVVWGQNVFQGCELLPDDLVPDVIVMSGEEYSSDIVNFEVPEGVYRVRRFSIHDKLKAVTLPDSLIIIESCSFSACYNLKDVNFGNGLKVIGYEAFSNCHSLERIVLPEGIKRIEHWAFCDCPNLKEITIPSSVTFMGDAIFDACSSELVIICKEGSVAHEYAIKFNLNYRFY